MRYNEIVQLNEAAMSPEDTDQLVKEYTGFREGDVEWHANKTASGKITITWRITFRRNTSAGAFWEYESEIRQANRQLDTIAEVYPDSVLEKNPLTLELAKKQDEFKEGNGDEAYSEYEQSFGGSISLKGAAQAGTPKRNLYDMVSKKLAGKKVGPIVWEVVAHQPDARGNESFMVMWKLRFSTKNTNREILTKYEAQIAKVEGILQELATKYADYLVPHSYYPLNRKDLIETDRYRASHDPIRDTAMGNRATFYVFKPKKKK